jgi:hypothetical protein
MKTPIDLIKQHIRLAEQSLILQREAGMADDFAVLFTGNWHDSIPRNVILNQQLSPVEKITWQALRLTIANPQQPGSAPSREGLAAMVNCSPPTVTSSRQMLRLTRYMTHCSTVRNQGRFVGEIYLLHDEPMTLSDTLQLDPEYIDFVKMLTTSNKAKALRQEAARVLREIDQINGLATVSPIETLAVRVQAGVENFPSALQRRDASVIKVQASNAEKPLPSKIFARENTVANDSSQSKNFALGGILTNPSKKHTETADNSDYIQRKNFALDGFLNRNDQSKFFAPATGGFCSSGSSKNINTNAHTRVPARGNAERLGEGDSAEDGDTAKFDQFMSDMGLLKTTHPTVTVTEPLATRGLQQVPKASWQLSEEEILSIGRPEVTPVLTAAKPAKWKRGINPSYSPVSADDTAQSFGEFFSRVKAAFPELDYPQIDRYLSIGFMNFYEGQLPLLVRLMAPLGDLERRDILAQYMARRASYIHGWHLQDIKNPIGFIKTLIEKLRSNHFVLDSHGVEFAIAISEKRAPGMIDSPELAQRHAEYRRDVGSLIA